MKKRFLLRQGMLFGVLAFFFIFCLGLDSEAFARAGEGRSLKNRGSNPSESSQQNPGSTPSSRQKNYQQPPPWPPSIPTASTPPSGTKTGSLSGIAAGVIGAGLGGMLFHRLGIHVPGWGAEFGIVDISVILLILGTIFYELKRLRAWRITRSASIRAGRSPYSSTYPVRTTGGNRRDLYMDKRRPARPPGIR